MSVLRIGTRGSPLARWQAEWVAAQLQSHGTNVELVPITTQGDQQQVSPIGQIGTQGVFTKELQRALLDGTIDLAVHSLKDLPTDVVPGLALLCVPEREVVDDVLISRAGQTLEQLPEGAIIGTGSLRRQSQLLHVRPDLVMRDIRGNVDTRLRKLKEGQYDAIVLARAGLTRLGLLDEVTQVLPRSVMLPAVGQGALGLEGRAVDEATRQAVAPLDHRATHQAVVAERALLAALRGGCLAPVAAWGRTAEQGLLHLSGAVMSLDGAKKLIVDLEQPPEQAAGLGVRVAQQLIEQGAFELIQAARELRGRGV